MKKMIYALNQPCRRYFGFAGFHKYEIIRKINQKNILQS